MDSKVLFHEQQQFRQWFIIVFFIAIDGFVIYKTMHDDMPRLHNSNLLGLVILTAVNFLFVLLKMETTIKEDGIHLRYFPIIRHRFYAWETIQTAETVKYNPMSYGGWGIRYGAYSVSGNKALQLQFKNGSKLLIGTKKPEAIQAVLNEIQK